MTNLTPRQIECLKALPFDFPIPEDQRQKYSEITDLVATQLAYIHFHGECFGVLTITPAGQRAL
jgi:hypothetical protein